MAFDDSINIDADHVDRLACAKCGHHMDLSGVAPFTPIVCPQCDTKQNAPLRLGSFLLLDELGKGGMGAVYRAYDSTLGRYVAIKVMQKSLANDQSFADNFIREARAAAALNNPHVVQIYSCGQERGQLYIVMELVDGGRLDKMIEGGKALDEVFTLEVGTQVAEGLLAASDIGLIHGDIKPGNILFDKQRRAKVVDFGLARFAAQQHLAPGEIWGTPYYIAPEKVRSRQEDHRADIYSLGATLYHVLAGAPPFDGETARDVVVARLNSPATNLLTVRPSLQPETAEVIARTLEQEPGRRYPTYKSLLADLEEAARIARQRAGMPPAKKKAGSKSHMPAVIVAGVVTVAMLVGGYFVFRSTDDPTAPAPLPAHLVPRDPTDPDAPVAPETAVAPEPDLQLPVQPFDEDMQEQLRQAVERWETGDSRGYNRAMNDLFRQVPRVGVERVWVGVLQGIPAWLEGRATELAQSLRGTPDAQLRELPDNQAHPGVMPQELSRFMVGRTNLNQLRQIADDWPDWYGDLVLLFEGIHHYREGRIDSARAALRAYSTLTPQPEAAWVYTYKDLARQWLEPLDDWESVAQSARDAAPQAARTQLQRYRRDAPRILHPAIDAEIAVAERRVRQADAARRAQEEREQQQRIETDVAQVAEIREQILPLVHSRDFRRAMSQARQSMTRMETAEGRAALEELIQVYARMDELRRFLIESISQRPAPAELSRELLGPVVGASLSGGLRISLGTRGFTALAWDQVSDRLLATLTDFYISDRSADVQAEHLLSLALLLHESGATRPARIYAERAVELQPGLASEVEAWMPDVNE